MTPSPVPYDADIISGCSFLTSISNNGSACDHLCLPRSDTETTCACAVGFMLFNRTACIPAQPNVLLFTSAEGLSGVGLLPGGGGQGERLLPPLNDVRRPVAVATLPSDNLIFWIDQSQASIFRSVH